MRSGFLGFGSVLVFSFLSAGPTNAQRVSADIRIGGRGPVSGHLWIGPSRDRYDDRRERAYRGRHVHVEMVRVSRERGWRDGWFRQMRRARLVAVYYDRREDSYYDRYRPGLLEIRVYQRDGRFYRLEDRRGEEYSDDRSDRRRDEGRGEGRYEGRNRRGGEGRNH